MTDKWYMTPGMVGLLAFIRKVEAGKAGYNADFRNDDKFPVTSMTLDQTIAAAKKQVAQGEGSSAIGGYQFLSKTLEGLKRKYGLAGSLVMTPEFQDDLAVALMIGRGLMKFARSEISEYTFANNLAKEWASMPVVTNVYNGKRWVQPGQSYYAGDGLNKSLVKVEDFLNAIRKAYDIRDAYAAKVAGEPLEPVEPVDEPPPQNDVPTQVDPEPDPVKTSLWAYVISTVIFVAIGVAIFVL